jgi:ribosomal protein S18 acetylase RimI-like enzyme
LDFINRQAERMIIRALETEDSLDELTDLLHRAYADLGKLGLNYTAVDQPVAVTAARIGRGECLVALDGGEIVGTVTYYRPGHSSGCAWYGTAHVATLGQLGVDPAYRSRGLGRALIDAVELKARDDGARELALDTAEPADHLIAWYARMGFRFVEYAQWAGKTYRTVILSKSLAN